MARSGNSSRALDPAQSPTFAPAGTRDARSQSK